MSLHIYTYYCADSEKEIQKDSAKLKAYLS